MNDWATKQFEKAGLRFHQGKPHGESPLNDLLRLLEKLGFEIDGKDGSHYIARHSDLRDWTESPSGAITIVKKHPASKEKPMTLEVYVKVALRAVRYLNQIGAIGDEHNDD